MKTLTINVLNDLNNNVWLFDRKTKTNMHLGKISEEKFEKLNSALKDNEDIICNQIGVGISYKQDELGALTTEELREICEVLNRKLEERDN